MKWFLGTLIYGHSAKNLGIKTAGPRVRFLGPLGCVKLCQETNLHSLGHHFTLSMKMTVIKVMFYIKFGH